ncbi:unnamed protein product [Rhizoctonia solani]|uniref:Uncharacterized protein n=1 Tax=Rhizoctonia solani TaxID=456999 RepID=A0A8H3C834_9AGAM|nr:unnamed protein product [Rhizoctonia solani]
MGRSPVRKHWHFFSRLVLLVTDIAGVVAYSLLISGRIKTGAYGQWFDREIATAMVLFVRFTLSFINDSFLLTYGFYYTDTVIGTFFFQQLIYHPIVIALFTAVAYRIQVDRQDYAYYENIYGESWRLDSLFVQSWQLIPLTARAGCDVLMTFALWCFLCGTKELRAKKLSCLGINIDELAAGVRVAPYRTITWRGVPRQRGRSFLQARALKSTWNVLYNSLFRRVVPVETRLQVLVQHIFSLVAIALLILRTVSSLRNSYENLPTRTIVGPCGPDKQYSTYGSDKLYPYSPPRPQRIYMRLPGHRSVSRDARESMLKDNRFTVNISLTRDCLEHGTATEPWTLKWIHTEPDEYDSVDWYGVFSGKSDVSCKQGDIDYLLPGRLPGIHTGYEYKIERRIDNTTAQRILNGSYAGIHRWFKDELPSFWLGNGDLTPSLSLPIQPEFGWYMTFKTQVAQRRFIVSSPLWDSITGSDPTYSTSSFFAPCTKLITPFGLAGRLATKGFKERLQERYHNSSQSQDQAESWQITDRSRATADVNLTQFLLDFVVDMGPASAPRPNREEMDAESSDSEDECQYKPVRRLGDVEEAGDVVRLDWRNAKDSLSSLSLKG